MTVTINVDVGGTFTHGFFSTEGSQTWVSVDTTPHDLTVCFLECLDQGARSLNIKMEEMLAQAAVVRLSTTVSTNIMLQRNGPKLGVMVTQGYESSLYAEADKANLPQYLLPFVLPEMIIPLADEIDEKGHIHKQVHEAEVRAALENLLDKGARGIVVCLKNSHANPANEQLVRRIAESEYPPHYLGSVRIVLSSDVTSRPGDQLRTNAAIISAYVRDATMRLLYKADDHLRQAGGSRPMLVVHSTGGVARVAKTAALDTYNSGPAGGLAGCTFLANEYYGIKDFLAVDVGGTSVDIGVVLDGKLPFVQELTVEDIPINVPMIQLETSSGGGGSIARVQGKGHLTVGPQSAGALPGPVSYDLGGIDPTVTDADLVLGRLNPRYYSGGRRILNADRARQAIEEKIARPLGVSVEEAALRILQTAESEATRAMAAACAQRGQRAQDLLLFAYGGGGGCRCCGYASLLGIHMVMVFPFSAAGGAYGSSTMDVNHPYEQWVNLPLDRMRESEEAVNSLVDKLRRGAERDMRGEGFASDDIRYVLQIELEGPMGVRTMDLPQCYVAWRELEEMLEPAGAGKAATVRLLRLTASCPMPHFPIPRSVALDKNQRKAVKGLRPVFWDKWQDTDIYERSLLQSGNEIEGPAIIEAPETTYVIPPGWSYTVDSYLNGRLKTQ